MLNAKALIGSHDLLFITLDTLRYDVAAESLAVGLTPNLAALLPGGVWEPRHSPGSFTLAAHQAFFSGFLPTPIVPGPHPRLFAAAFHGSETTGDTTFVFDAPTLVGALRQIGYYTACIGGVGFFNKLTAVGRVLPDLFDESHWSVEMGVASDTSTARQVDLACRILRESPADRRLFLFINVSALHQPNCIFAPGECRDTPRTQAAALSYVDRCLPPLFDTLRARGDSLCILCSDHGTAYGEDGYTGHRLAHPVVWTVPYCEFVLPRVESGAP